MRCARAKNEQNTHKRVFRRFAVANQTGSRSVAFVMRTRRLSSHYEMTHLALASLTRIRGLARSSRSRWLCSVRRRSLSSDIDCLCGRPFMFDESGEGKVMYWKSMGSF